MKTLQELHHFETPITGGGNVIVLDTGSIIGPEAAAMLQALHSRSVGGLKSHLEILEKRGAENFMKNFYVGYGHKSIGDCGTISIFIEGVSMLCAKAVQDWPLYSGQEASTRYIDFQIQPFKNPLENKGGEKILENWRSFYQNSLEQTKKHLSEKFPIQEGEDTTTYKKAIDARAFDTLRGFLPAGATTNLAWHTNLRQAADKIAVLRHHPLEEVRNTALALEDALIKAFPNSFSHKRYEETEKYNEFIMKEDYYYHSNLCPDFKLTNNTIDEKLLKKEVLEKRPAKTELPKHLTEAGTLQFEFLLDFGSFRDVQRHRAVTQRMPLLTTELGFESWYLDELDEELRKKSILFLKEQEDEIKKICTDPILAQYYTAMGYKTSNRLTGTLPALVYLAELRATRFVHPTLRLRAQQIAQSIENLFGKNGLVIHLDKDSDRFDIKRGEHDIVLK